MRRLSFALVAVAAGVATPASGQLVARPTDGQLAGVVLDSATSRPIPFPLIGFRNQRFFGAESGRFTLTGVAGGTHLLTVSQLGYAPYQVQILVTSDPTVAASPEIRILLAKRAFLLPEIVVSGSVGCARGLTAAEGNPLEPVIEAALANAERVLVLERGYPFESRFAYRREQYQDGVRDPEVFGQTLVTSTKRSGEYRPGKVMHKKRAVVDYFRTADLARPRFRDNHCFWYSGADSVQGLGLVHRIEFGPTERVESPDWAGTLRVQDETAKLVESQARLVNVDTTKRGLVEAECIVRYAEVAPTLPHESDAECMSTDCQKRRVLILEHWRLLTVNFLERRPDE